jgi:putative glutamine amidotransferase
LYLDLASRGYSRHHDEGGKENRHTITVQEQTMLAAIIGKKSGEVNSFHHQGVERVGKGLVVSARSDDGVIEGMEWADRNEAPFLLAVQWHPERMKDTSNPLSEKIGRAFLEEINKHEGHS